METYVYTRLIMTDQNSSYKLGSYPKVTRIIMWSNSAHIFTSDLLHKHGSQISTHRIAGSPDLIRLTIAITTAQKTSKGEG